MKERYEIASDLEVKIWESKKQAAITEWDKYTDKLPLGNWEDLIDCEIELAINFADDIIRRCRIEKIPTHWVGSSANMTFE